jgi:hypothetical protein
MGFRPLECIKELLGEKCPCLFMVKKIDTISITTMSLAFYDKGSIFIFILHI